MPLALLSTFACGTKDEGGVPTATSVTSAAPRPGRGNTPANLGRHARGDLLWWTPYASPPSAAVGRMADTATVAQFGAASPMLAGAHPLGVGDFDGDGYSDVLLNDNGALCFSTIRGTAFDAPRPLRGNPRPAGYSVVAVADFDGDNVTDVLFRDATSRHSPRRRFPDLIPVFT